MVEVDEPTPSGSAVRGLRPDEVAAKAQQTFESALEKIKPVATALIKKLREPIDAPDEIGVEFGVKLSGEAGVVLAATGVEAHFKVSLAWKRKEASAS